MFGQYAAFIIPAYAVSALVILLMIVSLRLQYTARKKELDELEGAGVKRRSAKKKSNK